MIVGLLDNFYGTVLHINKIDIGYLLMILVHSV